MSLGISFDNELFLAVQELLARYEESALLSRWAKIGGLIRIENDSYENDLQSKPDRESVIELFTTDPIARKLMDKLVTYLNRPLIISLHQRFDPQGKSQSLEEMLYWTRFLAKEPELVLAPHSRFAAVVSLGENQRRVLLHVWDLELS